MRCSPSTSNEHVLFAETLRNWRDPQLHRHQSNPVLLCPRCVACKCKSLKDFHHPSCPRLTYRTSKRCSSSDHLHPRTTTSKIPVRIRGSTSQLASQTRSFNENIDQRLVSNMADRSIDLSTKKKCKKKRHQRHRFSLTRSSNSTSDSSPSTVAMRKKRRSMKTFGLSKSLMYVWKTPSSSTLDENSNYPICSIEQFSPTLDEQRTSFRRPRDILLERTPTDSWQTVDVSTASTNLFGSFCENFTGSASNLFSPASDGHFISISTTKRSSTSLLNQIKTTQWSINRIGQRHRKKSFSADQLKVSIHSESSSEAKDHHSAPADLLPSNTILSVSTDEDVDEFHSNYSEIIDRPTTRILSAEYSQMTVDSGVDINSERKINTQPSTIVDYNDLFALSDDSLIEMESDTTTTTTTTMMINDPYCGYELETITDEDEDEKISHSHPSAEILITSERKFHPSPPAPPPQFQFQLPSFGEWIDRVFTNFLAETNQSIASSRSSSIVSIPNTSSSSPVITVIETPNVTQMSVDSYPPQDSSSDNDDDMSSSSVTSEKVDYDTYIINSNYEKINSSIMYEKNEIAFIKQCETSSIENCDQEFTEKMSQSIMPETIDDPFPSSTNSQNSFLQSSSFHSKDSAFELSDENFFTLEKSIHLTPCSTNEQLKQSERSFSSTSSEQLIPKEKETGMYYPAFGSSAAIHLSESFPLEWLEDSSPRIVHCNESLHDNEDEFFYSPRPMFSSVSCSNLVRAVSRIDRRRTHSLTSLDYYANIPFTQELLEQIWHSLLNLDHSDQELNDDHLGQFIGLSNSSTGLIEKSRSHNDIYSLQSKHSTVIDQVKSKSFDVTFLIKRSIDHQGDEPDNVGLLQGADISEPFADRVLSGSMLSDVDSLPSLIEHETVVTIEEPTVDPSSLIEGKSTEDELVLLTGPMKKDTFTELSLFRPHSLSTIPSSRASQYASSLDSDDGLEHERYLKKDFINGEHLHHLTSDDDRGLIGSEFSSPQSRPLSSIKSPSSILEQPSPIEEETIVQPPLRIDKVTDLEIVKQGKGFRIGYVDRQGTDQRIILTKRLEVPADLLERESQHGLSYKGRKVLNQNLSSVLYTNGYHKLQEDLKFERAAEDIEVPIIGTDPKHFDESDMISIDIDGPSTLLNSVCESLVITQGSIYPSTLCVTPSKCDRIEVTDRWRDQTIIHGSSTTWRSPLKAKKSNDASKLTMRDIALSPILLPCQSISTSPVPFISTVDRACQCSPLEESIDHLKNCHEHSAFEAYGSKSIPTATKLERSADSGILVDVDHHHHPAKCHLALQVDLKNSSSDSDDLSEVTPRPLIAHPRSSSSTSDIEQEILQLRRERTHVVDLLALNWNRSNIWVELTEAKLNYIIGETDALLRTLSFDPTPMDNELVKTKMDQYEEDMTQMTRQRLAVYRERLEVSRQQLDRKIDQLESKKSAMEKNSTEPILFSSLHHDPINRSMTKRSTTFLSTSVENLSTLPRQEALGNDPNLLDISFLTSSTTTTTNNGEMPVDFSLTRTSDDRTIYRPRARYPSGNGNLMKMEGLSSSQQAIIDETDELVRDSQQLHSESASQFERARESLLSSETSIRMARANLVASRHVQSKDELTLAELFQYEQSLAKETARNHRYLSLSNARHSSSC